MSLSALTQTVYFINKYIQYMEIIFSNFVVYIFCDEKKTITKILKKLKKKNVKSPLET